MDALDVPRREEQLYAMDKLVKLANEVLPQILPTERTSNRMVEEVNPRLVRHLSSLGLLDDPEKHGKEARYGYRHLLQLLTSRRLMAEGYTTGAVKRLIGGISNEELEAILKGGLVPGVQQSGPGVPWAAAPSREGKPPASEVENSATRFLNSVRARSASRPALHQEISSPNPGASLPISPPPAVHYQRIPVRPGLEVHVAEPFHLPPSAHEREELLREVLGALAANATHFTRRPRR